MSRRQNVIEFPANDPISSSTEDGVRDDLKFLKESPMMRKELSEHLHGFLYDIKTGKVQEIKAVEDKNL